jgi:hypothetical protein
VSVPLALIFESSLSSAKLMAAQLNPQRKKSATRPVKEATVAIQKAQIKKKVFTQAKTEEKARPKSRETLAEAQKALRAAQAMIKRERQTRIKAEAALAEAQETLAAARLKGEQGHEAQIRRVSFVVRLMLDEHGQPRRTEIEQVESSRKQNFPGLDGERLVAFMKACTSPTIIPEPAIPPAPPPEKGEAPTPMPLRPKSSLIVSDVRVFRLGDPDFMTLILTREEPFVVQARFQLQGPEAQFHKTQQSFFEMKVYANEVTSGKSKLLTTYSAKLIQNVLEYTAPVEVPGLPLGLYRLFTVVILSAPIKMAQFYGKTIIHVT